MCILIGGVTKEEGELTRDTNSPFWELSGFVYSMIRVALHCPLCSHAGIRMCVLGIVGGKRSKQGQANFLRSLVYLSFEVVIKR